MQTDKLENVSPTFGNTVLCDGFLIPMTDFVLEQLNEQNSRTKPMREVFNSLEKYAKFLKQPLKLEMFVPCVEGEPIEYVELKKTGGKLCQVGSEIEKEAKEKVLFENISIREINYFINHFQKIEDLFYSRGGKTLKLSQTALNAIFGTFA